jgi:hypothetical protein
MRAFISYSVAEKEWGGRIKQALESIGVRCFLAHEDMQVSEEWRARIIEELREVDIFVTVLSERFKASEWCSQEVGFIFSRPEVVIVPLAIDRTTPYGFLATLQGCYVADEGRVPVILEEVLFRKKPRQMIPMQIRKVGDASSFRGAEAAVRPLVPHFRLFSDDEVVAFAEAAARNYEVWDASLCRSEYIPAFVLANGRRIPENLRAELKACIDDLAFPQ